MKCVTLTAETFKNRRDALAVKVLAIQASAEFGSPNHTEMLGGWPSYNSSLEELRWERPEQAGL